MRTITSTIAQQKCHLKIMRTIGVEAGGSLLFGGCDE